MTRSVGIKDMIKTLSLLAASLVGAAMLLCSCTSLNPFRSPVEGTGYTCPHCGHFEQAEFLGNSKVDGECARMISISEFCSACKKKMWGEGVDDATEMGNSNQGVDNISKGSNTSL